MEIRNVRDVAADVMTKPDQEGLIVRNVINRDEAGARAWALDIPPPTAETILRLRSSE